MRGVSDSNLHQNNHLQCKLLFWKNCTATPLSQCSPNSGKFVPSIGSPGHSNFSKESIICAMRDTDPNTLLLYSNLSYPSHISIA